MHIQSLVGRSLNCINRDIEVNDSLMFAVADEGDASLQIYNLNNLPGPPEKIYDSDSLCKNAHNIALNAHFLLLCKNFRGGKKYAMEILDVSDPKNPVLVGTLIPPAVSGVSLFPYVHDVCVAGDTIYCSCANGGLFIYDISNKSKPRYIAALTSYPLAGYNHSSAWYAPASCLYFTDENKGAGMKVVDFRNFKKPDIPAIVQPAPGVTPHNPAVSGGFILLASYQEGVVIYSLSNPLQPEKVYFYDTYPQNIPGDYDGLKGCWTAIGTDRDSIFLASDTENGLFVLKTPFSLGHASLDMQSENFECYPNPSNGFLYFKSIPKVKSIKLLNHLGQMIYEFPSSLEADLSFLSSGMYYISIGNVVKKIVMHTANP
jgi:hypothetical protein